MDIKQQTFLNVVVREPHHKSDHFMVLGFLLIHPLQEKKLTGESVALPTEAVSNGHRYKIRHPLQGAARGNNISEPKLLTVDCVYITRDLI